MNRLLRITVGIATRFRRYSTAIAQQWCTRLQDDGPSRVDEHVAARVVPVEKQDLRSPIRTFEIRQKSLDSKKSLLTARPARVRKAGYKIQEGGVYSTFNSRAIIINDYQGDLADDMGVVKDYLSLG